MEICHATGSQKKAGESILISGKVDFKLKIVIRDEEGHYIIIKESINQEELTNVNVHAQHESTQIYKSINHKYK